MGCRTIAAAVGSFFFLFRGGNTFGGRMCAGVGEMLT